jgi:hypothetical protein
MGFWKDNRRFILPALYGVASSLFLWSALHSDQFWRYLASIGFACNAAVTYLGQRTSEHNRNAQQ